MSARKAAAAGCSRALPRAGFSTTAARHRGASAPKRTDARESLIDEAVVYTFVVHYTEARAPVPRAHSPLVGEQRRAINLELRDFSPDFDSKMRGNSIDPLTKSAHVANTKDSWEYTRPAVYTELNAPQ